MKLRIEIDLENAAFEDDPGAEIRCILRNVPRRLTLTEVDSVKLRDSNGNRVGSAEVVED